MMEAQQALPGRADSVTTVMLPLIPLLVLTRFHGSGQCSAGEESPA